MLQKNDLAAIGKIVESQIEKQVRPIVKEELEPLKKDLKKIKRDLKKTSAFLDREILADRKRILRVEKHLNFS